MIMVSEQEQSLLNLLHHASEELILQTTDGKRFLLSPFLLSPQKRKQVPDALSYGNNFQAHLLEQYKLLVGMTERTIDRRKQTNSFYVSLLSGLLTVITIATSQDIIQFQNTQFQSVAFLAVAILGMILCVVWFANIQVYQQDNSSHYKVINKLEKYLPYPCIDRAWKLSQGYRKSQLEFIPSNVEKIVPLLLVIPYIGLFIYSLLNIVLPFLLWFYRSFYAVLRF